MQPKKEQARLAFSIAVAGKGGTGKTTLSTLIVRYLISHKLTPILAIDADPNANFGESMGLEVGDTVGSTIAGFNEDKIRLPSGMTKEGYLEFKLNGTLVESRGVDLLTMGRGQGADCYCYPNLVLRKFADSLVNNYPYVVMDNEAGMEHLSRKTTDNIDVLMMVSNHSIKGVRAVARIRDLVRELKLSVGREMVVITSVPNTLDPLLKEEMHKLNIDPAALIPCDESIQKYDFERRTLLDLPDESEAVAAVGALMSGVLNWKTAMKGAKN
jgi:CO dehydrogenase maturation factor